MHAIKQVLPAVYKHCILNKGMTRCRSISFMFHQRQLSSAAIPSPSLDAADKQYSEKIINICDEISNLTLLEVRDLNDLLKDKLNISDVPMAAAAPVVAGQVEEDAPAVKVQDEFTIKLTDYNKPDKIKLIKCVKAIVPEADNLARAKAFVENLPQTIKKEATKEETEELKKQLEAAGGVVAIE